MSSFLHLGLANTPGLFGAVVSGGTPPVEEVLWQPSDDPRVLEHFRFDEGTGATVVGGNLTSWTGDIGATVLSPNASASGTVTLESDGVRFQNRMLESASSRLGLSADPSLSVFVALRNTQSVAVSIEEMWHIGGISDTGVLRGDLDTNTTVSWRHNNGNRVLSTDGVDLSAVGQGRILVWSHATGGTYGEGSIRLDGVDLSTETGNGNPTGTPTSTGTFMSVGGGYFAGGALVSMDRTMTDFIFVNSVDADLRDRIADSDVKAIYAESTACKISASIAKSGRFTIRGL